MHPKGKETNDPRFHYIVQRFWYRDFPLARGWKETGSRAEWTTHIGICVRSTADLLGYFTHFEAGRRTDAVIKDARGETVAHVEWEWLQPYRDAFNELGKLYSHRGSAAFSALVTFSGNEHHEENMKRIATKWKNCAEPLLLFLVRYKFRKGRHPERLETYLVNNGRARKMRSQPALPWEALGRRWAKYTSHP